MLMVAKNNIIYFAKSVKCSIRSAMAYKVNFLIQAISMFINNAFFLIFWQTIFANNGGSVGNVTMTDILYLWSLPTIAYGICYFFFGGVENICTDVLSGQLDTYKIKPKPPLLGILPSRCDFTAFGDMAYGLIVGAFAVQGDIGKYILLILLGIYASIFYISSEIMIRSLVFWIGDVSSFADTYAKMGLITFTIYPINIFRKGIKVILFTIVPAGYIAHLPISIVNCFNVKYLAIFVIAGIIYLLTAITIFNVGIKRYESGNTISMKG